jgi:hypothetical protein
LCFFWGAEHERGHPGIHGHHPVGGIERALEAGGGGGMQVATRVQAWLP